MTHGKKTSISVVVPVRNGGAPFLRCLDALFESRPKPKEIIVVSDADTDGSWCAAKDAGARVVRLETKKGPAAARNAGAREARGEIILFVDADVLIRPDAVKRVGELFEADPGLAALFGSYDDEPGAWNFLSRYRNLLHHYIHQTSKEEAETFFAGLGAVRRSVFLSAGGFDESYAKPSIEDIELGYRLTDSGHKIRLIKDLQATHLKRWGVLSLIGTDLFRRGIPWSLLILQGRGFTGDLNLKPHHRISALLSWALAGSLFSSFKWPDLLSLALALALALVLFNLPLYRFFYRKRGLEFTLKAIPWHWLHYFICGLAFALALIIHLGHLPRAGKTRAGNPASFL